MVKNNCFLKIDHSEDTLCAHLCGDLDHHSAVAVRTLIDAEIRKHYPKKTVLDMSKLDFMDSSGIGLIMGRYALMDKLGGKLTVANPNERTLRILKLAGLERMVTIEICASAEKEGNHEKRRK